MSPWLPATTPFDGMRSSWSVRSSWISNLLFSNASFCLAYDVATEIFTVNAASEHR
jgi:hypothetical protein